MPRTNNHIARRNAEFDVKKENFFMVVNFAIDDIDIDIYRK